MTPEMQAIVRRLEEAEKQIAHVAAVLTEHSDPDRAVEAQSFIVRDEQGQRRAELGLRIPIGLAEPHPWLGFFDAAEHLCACIGVGAKGPWLEMYNEKGKVGVEITFEADNPTLRLFNEDGNPSLAVANSKLGAFLALLNPDGKERLSMSLSGNPKLLMNDASGETVLKLAADSDGPHLLFGKGNKVFWSAP